MSDEIDPLGILGKTLEEKYRIESLAGMGGFSAVYRAQHLVWNEPVAIKFFTMLDGAEPELREQLLQDFVQEGKLMSQLSSRSAAIVQARDMGKLKINDDGEWIPYMVLEWLDGIPLNEVVSRERKAGMVPRSLEEVMTLLEPAAIALDVAHRGNVAHRDLKPANFVITGDPRDPSSGLKVLDFGIAKVMEAQVELNEQMQQTGQHITAFTPNYGAPEQFSRNFGATGPWTDVYAMALIALELVKGTRVLDGESFFELGVATSKEEDRPTPRTLGLEVSDAVEAVFSKALAVDPKQRYPNMGQFWQSLHQAVFPGADTWTPRTDKPSLRNLQEYLSNTRQSSSSVIITPMEGGQMHRADTVSAMSFPGRHRRGRAPILWVAGAVAIASIVVLGVAISNRTAKTPERDDSAAAVAPPDVTTEPSAQTTPPSKPAPEPTEGTEGAEGTATAPSAKPSATPSSTAQPAPIQPHARTQPKTTPQPTEPKKPPSQPPSGPNAWDPSSFGGRR